MAVSRMFQEVMYQQDQPTCSSYAINHQLCLPHPSVTWCAFLGSCCMLHSTLLGSMVLVPCETVCTELVMARAGAGACGCRWWCVRGGPRVKPGAAQLVPTLVPWGERAELSVLWELGAEGFPLEPAYKLERLSLLFECFEHLRHLGNHECLRINFLYSLRT